MAPQMHGLARHARASRDLRTRNNSASSMNEPAEFLGVAVSPGRQAGYPFSPSKSTHVVACAAQLHNS